MRGAPGDTFVNVCTKFPSRFTFTSAIDASSLPAMFLSGALKLTSMAAEPSGWAVNFTFSTMAGAESGIGASMVKLSI